ncbi:MAG: DEAD/DEAH box helicase [Planctomycetes bacterium]|nr:DEAD/DEAH box helicase [Planctomycetota bacterium]
MTSTMPEHFSELPLSPIMQRALAQIGWSKPSPIQARVIPYALEGYDILGQARTGTGKTASFAIPILEQLDPLRVNPLPQALVLVPTRELANQVYGEFVRLAEGCPTQVVEVSGGKHMQKQLNALAKGVQVVVGTPGRVIDHIQRGSLRLQGLWCVVLDEADRMLDIGFRPSIERILRRCPENRQTLLLSATLDERIRDLANRYLFEPVVIDCSDKDVSVETIEQRFISVSPDRKQEVLLQLLEREQPPQAIIFCRTKIGTAKLHRQLERYYAAITDRKVRVGTIHGDMSQPQRDEVFKALRENKLDILVATDVVGRGIDVSSISHIINYDLPDDCDDYVHRVGRTGRMGRSGIAFSFVSKDQGYLLTDIEQRINRMLEKDPLSEVVGKRRESLESLNKSEAPKVDTTGVVDSTEEPKSEPAGAEEHPFGSAPARRTLGRAKSRGSIRRR